MRKIWKPSHLRRRGPAGIHGLSAAAMRHEARPAGAGPRAGNSGCRAAGKGNVPPSIRVTFVKKLLGKLPAIGEMCSCAMKLRSAGEAVRAGTPPRPSQGALTDLPLHLGDSTSVKAMRELSTYSHLTDTFQITSVLIPRKFYAVKE